MSELCVCVCTPLLPQTRAAFEDSLVKLKTDYVDMVLLHAPGCWEGMCEPDLDRGTYQDAWRALEVRSGVQAGRPIMVCTAIS